MERPSLLDLNQLDLPTLVMNVISMLRELPN